MTTENQKRTYANAGRQKSQGWDEMHRYGEFGPDHLVTVQCISMILGIRLQMVKQIPVERRMIDKRGYYRKGDIETWLVEDMAKPDSLLKALRAQHAKSLKRMVMEPSRRYVRAQLTSEETAQVKKTNAAFVWPQPTKDELSGGWRKGLAGRRNQPIPGEMRLTEADAKTCAILAESVREELKMVAEQASNKSNKGD